VILEAANGSSRSVNADYPRALAINRDDIDEETRDALRNPTTTAELDLAPTYIFWYWDGNYIQGALGDWQVAPQSPPGTRSAVSSFTTACPSREKHRSAEGRAGRWRAAGRPSPAALTEREPARRAPRG
jgi:hypothetical protein